MSDLDLEDRLTTSLHRGAGAAPLATGAVRQTVRRRSRSLQRRQGAVRAASVAAAASLVAGAGVVLRSDDSGPVPLSTIDEPSMDPAHRGAWPPPPAGDGTLPTFTIDGQPPTESSVGEPESVDREEPGVALGFQTFREPGNWSGPTVSVEHKKCGDCSGLEEGLPPADRAEPVTVGGRDAQLWLLPPDGRLLSWNRADGSRVLVGSRGLATTELLRFAEGLRPKGERGFTATDRPAGLAEDTSPGQIDREVARRLESFTVDGADSQLIAMQGDEELIRGETGPFSNNLYVDVVEHVTVLGRPAVLLHVDDTIRGANDLPPYWDLVWRHTTDSVVLIRTGDVDRAGVQRIIDGIRET